MFSCEIGLIRTKYYWPEVDTLCHLMNEQEIWTFDVYKIKLDRKNYKKYH